MEQIKTQKKDGDKEITGAKEASKEFLPEERDSLAKEIREKRAENRKNIEFLKLRLNLVKSGLEAPDNDFEKSSQKLEELDNVRNEEVNELAAGVKEILDSESTAENNEEIGQATKTVESSINSDQLLSEIKQKIEQHYQKAEGIGLEQREKKKQTVKESILRNNCFFVHTIKENSSMRHNVNSNVSKEATFEDDLDILVSLEPSISASIVVSGADEEGKVSGLWSHSGGVIIGEGQIAEANFEDAQTISMGVKERRSPKNENSDSKILTQRIDDAARKRTTKLHDLLFRDMAGRERRFSPGEWDRGNYSDQEYNEYVVNNPKIFGYYLPAEQGPDGKFYTSLEDKESRKNVINRHVENIMKGKNISTKNLEENLSDINGRFNEYIDRVKLIKERNIPLYIL
jgi:hypothetical protein